MVIEAAKVPDSAYYRETPAWTLTSSVPALPLGWPPLQKLGSYLGGHCYNPPSPDPLTEAVLSQSCPPSPDSFPFIFNPFFGHNVSRWNSYCSLPAPIRTLGWLFLVSLLCLWEMLLGGPFGRTPAHHGQGCGLTSPLRPSLLAEDARSHQPSPQHWAQPLLEPTSLPALGLLAPLWQPKWAGVRVRTVLPHHGQEQSAGSPWVRLMAGGCSERMLSRGYPTKSRTHPGMLGHWQCLRD